MAPLKNVPTAVPKDGPEGTVKQQEGFIGPASEEIGGFFPELVRHRLNDKKEENDHPDPVRASE